MLRLVKHYRDVLAPSFQARDIQPVLSAIWHRRGLTGSVSGAANRSVVVHSAQGNFDIDDGLAAHDDGVQPGLLKSGEITGRADHVAKRFPSLIMSPADRVRPEFASDEF